ncbi:cell division protein SepF [Neomoorella humiferrea]|uniref:Cell division protein SepF n=1 Tax=Neomoorella humiferrea TaxID=676965 RepID=A0A2T0AMT2_9FIRM|nr:cell division protein SepF [Moorella humiferrea]PRR70178.1 Cell division protein SepF [Moorella humiferrea]
MAFWDGLLQWLGYGSEEDDRERDNGGKAWETPVVSPIPAAQNRAKVVSLPTARQSLRLVVARPQSFDQAAGLAEHLKNYRPLIVNVEAMPVDEARRIVDFLSGATYALGGMVRRVTSGIFLFTPSNIDLSGDLEEHMGGSINWLEAAGRK